MLIPKWPRTCCLCRSREPCSDMLVHYVEIDFVLKLGGLACQTGCVPGHFVVPLCVVWLATCSSKHYSSVQPLPLLGFCLRSCLYQFLSRLSLMSSLPFKLLAQTYSSSTAVSGCCCLCMLHFQLQHKFVTLKVSLYRAVSTLPRYT